MEHMEQKGTREDPLDNHKDVLQMGESEFRKLVVALFREGRDRMGDLEELIHANTEITKKNAEASAELIKIFEGAKTGASTFAWVGRNLRSLIKFLYPFILFGGAVWAIVHGKWPKMGE